MSNDQGQKLQIPELTHKNLERIVERCFETKQALFEWGTFGIGKSYATKEIAKKIAKRLKLNYSEDKDDYNKEDTFVMRTIPIHQWDVSELKGLPFPNKDHTKTTFLQTDELPTSGQGIIFFDELPLAPPMVQANTYQIIQDRQLGNYKVPPGYLIIAAGNFAEDRAHNFDMSMPLRNRFSHVALRIPTVEEWALEFALKNNISNSIINFLKWREEFLHSYDPDMEDDTLAVATPRTWEFASKAIEGIDNDLDFVRDLMGSNVGVPIAAEFTAWLELTKSYDIAQIFKTGKFDAPTAIDKIYAFITAAIAYYKKKSTQDNAVMALDIVTRFDPEHAIMFLSQLKYADDQFLNKIKKGNPKGWKASVEKYMKYLL